MSKNKKIKYHFLYKTTNLINGKYYYGMHSTYNMEDGYLGSGKRLRYSIRKYGKENFIIEIINFYNSREELINGEISLINDNIIVDELCMNIKLGGTGGFSSIEHQINASIEGNLKLKYLRENDDEFRENWLNKKNKFKNGFNNPNYGKSMKYFLNRRHTEDTKEKIRKKLSELQKGEKNSQFGTCWITKDNKNKKIKKEELNNYLNDGWLKGRKMVLSSNG
jgi:hypothetical protein